MMALEDSNINSATQNKDDTRIGIIILNDFKSSTQNIDYLIKIQIVSKFKCYTGPVLKDEGYNHMIRFHNF